MPRKKTNKEFLKEVSDLVGSEYSALSKYIDSRTHVVMKHNKCGHIYKVTPANFLYGKRCPICMRKQSDKKKRKSNEQFLSEVNELVGDEYTVLDKYETAIKKIRFRHNKCNNIFEMTPNNFLLGNRCPVCGFENLLKSNKWTEEEFAKNLKERTNGECVAIDRYINTQTPIRFKHLECGNIFKAKPSHVLAGHYCKECGDKKTGDKLRKTHKQYVKEVYDLVGNEYEVLGEYKRDDIKIKMIHNTCGRTFYKRAGSFLQGTRCPHCAESKGEKKIFDFLIKHNIEHKREYRDKRCKNKYTLPFDFAIFNEGKLACLIEYDGELHYKEARWSGAEEKLLSMQKTDRIKDGFCDKYGIPLIKIPYWEYDNVEKILENEFRNLSIL